jgi:putative transposase
MRMRAYHTNNPQSRKRHLISLRFHRARNVLAKVPAHAHAEVKAAFWAIFDDPDAEPGQAAVAEATRRAQSFAAKWRKLYPSAVACLEDDFEHLVTYLRFPAEHQGRIRHSNFIERTFGETRRRVKVIGRLPGERSCLSLVWAGPAAAGAGCSRPWAPSGCWPSSAESCSTRRSPTRR